MTSARLAAGFRFALYCAGKGAKMNRYGIIALAAAVTGSSVTGLLPASAQTTTFRNYHCADGTEFIVGFYPHDPSAYLQIDGGAVMLRKRLAASGTRYSAAGVTLKVSRLGRTTVKRPKRAETTCEVM
jgi:membrane-bound inhibitor of C-type lysozyme